MPDDLEFVYVGDPLCSWCWGFAPVLERLEARYEIPIRVVTGGLRPGPAAQPLDDRLRAFLLQHWESVESASGQPFDRSVLDRDGWVYDTEPPCRAVVTVREMAPMHTLAWFARVQRGFYTEGVDVTDPHAYAALLADFPVDVETFTERFRSDEAREQTLQDFAEARRLGANGFPTLLLRLGSEHAVVTRGFVRYEQLEPALTEWLQTHFGEAAEGLVCEVGEPR